MIEVLSPGRMMRTKMRRSPRTSLPATSEAHLSTACAQKNSTCSIESGFVGFANSGLFRSLASMCMLLYVLPQDCGFPLPFAKKTSKAVFEVCFQSQQHRDMRDQTVSMHYEFHVDEITKRGYQGLEIFGLLRHPRGCDKYSSSTHNFHVPLLCRTFPDVCVALGKGAIHAIKMDSFVAHRHREHHCSSNSSSTAHNHRFHPVMFVEKLLDTLVACA